MSEENVELVRSMFRDPSRFFDLLDEEVEQEDAAARRLPEYPPEVVFVHGKDAVISAWTRYWDAWDDCVLEPTEFIDADEDKVVVVTDERGRGRESGAPFEQRTATIFTLRAGKIVRFHILTSREEALEAAGLSE